MSCPAPPIIFFAFANDRVDKARYLRNLPEELRQVREAMTPAEQANLCEMEVRSNATVVEVLDFFQDTRFRNRVAIFHFGGHAGSGVLLFESPDGAARAAHAGGFARFLGEQRGLALVFLNGCSTQGQVENLLADGVPAVIATSQDIPDAVATELSSRFYKALASGAPLRAAFNEAAAAVQTRTGQEAKPWDFYVKPGAEERVERWSLPVAARDPLFGLPALPEMDLPRAPFKHLAPFTRADAHVFFGRGREIRELFEAATLSDAPPIALLFGVAGAGKSSLLAAGLQPRLEASHDVLYLRRDGQLGLSGTLAQALPDWHQQEERSGKPLIVILDQAEEAWTRPLTGGGEIEAFASVLRALFAVRESRPQGRLILGFRKEWLAEVLRLLDAEELPRTRVEVTHLDQAGVREAVAGIASTGRLKRQYRLEIDEELPPLIAVDLLKQREDTIAPILQILLTKMWAHATTESPEGPRFTVGLYKDMERCGLLLDDFLGEQLDGLREWQTELVDSGLVLDLLAYHTTPLSTAETHREAEVVERYKHRPEISEFLEKCKDRYLLSGSGGPATDRTTRLAHDTLAPLVRQRFEQSGLPGQRALRILQQREVDWEGGRTGAFLDDFDLAGVEKGQGGMRAPTPDEERLVVASRREADRRKGLRRGLQVVAVAAVVMILGVAGLAWWKGQQALASEERSRDRERVSLASNFLGADPTEAALVLLEVRRPSSTPTASDLLQKVLAEPLEVATLSRNGRVTAGSFSPDGTRVVTASKNKTARIWNALSGQPVITLTGHTDEVYAASFSLDGTQVVTASKDKTARIWNAFTGQPVAILCGHTGEVQSASFSRDGTRVVTASEDKTARTWNATTGQPVATLHTGAIYAASFSPDGTQIVTAVSDATARIWNAATGQPVAILAGHADTVWAASFSPDGTQVVTASKDKTARIWNATTGQPVAILTGHTGEVVAASFSPDGSRVVTVSSDEAGGRIWNVTTDQPVAILMGHTDTDTAASFSPDGTRVLTASYDKTARIWNALTGRPIAILKGHTQKVTAASFSPDGTRLVTASDQTAQIWNALTGQLVSTLTGHTRRILAVAYSPDGTRIVTASEDRTARIWNAFTGRPVVILIEHIAAPVTTASFSPDGTRVVTAADKTAQIWKVLTGQLVATMTGHTRGILAASFSPDGTRIVTASGDKTARIWNAFTGQPVVPRIGHIAPVTTASFSPDSTRVVTTSFDQDARVWNALTGQLVATLTGHTSPVYAASFSPDSTQVVTTSFDQTARIWNALTGQPVATLFGGMAPGTAASFSPDGTRVLTASYDGTARIWASGTEYLQSLIRGQNRLCLEAKMREVTLGENPQEAEGHEEACNACVPKFFTRLKGVPAGDAKTYIAAWREYRQCLDAISP